MSDEHVQTWTAIVDRLTAFLDGLSEDEADRTVPATEDWNVRELVSHMVGVDADALAGRSDAEFSRAWTQTHVDQRAAAALSDVLLEWRSLRDPVRELLASAPDEQAVPLCIDAYWHEQDVYTAFPDMIAITDDPALAMALAAFAQGFGQRVQQHGLPALQLQAGSWTSTAGAGAPGATVRADPYELARALSGRRSARQVRRFDWQGDPTPYLPVFSMFGALRDDDLDEQEIAPTEP